MTTRVKTLLKTFEDLSDKEKRQLASEILRRCVRGDWPDLTDQELAQAAEQLFLELDAREATHG